MIHGRSMIGEVMKHSWRKTTIGEIATLGSGTTPSRAIDAFYSGGTIWWVKTGDLNNGYITTTEEKITDFAITNASSRVYPPDTLLVAMYGGFKQIGRTGLLQVHAAINQALTAISVDRATIWPMYLLHWLTGN